MSLKSKSHGLQAYSSESSRLSRVDGARCGRTAVWKWGGIIGFFLVVLLGIAILGNTNVTSAQRSTTPGAEPKDSVPIAKDDAKAKQNDGHWGSCGVVTITDTSSTPGAMPGHFDCSIRANIDPGTGQVSTMDRPKVFWKDATMVTIGDYDLLQVGTTTIWEWSGTLISEPRSAEVIAHFVNSDSDEKGVPYIRGGLTIDSIHPAAGETGEKYKLTITGQNFNPRGEAGYVRIGTFDAKVRSWENEVIVIETSAAMTSSPGKKQVVVHNGNHQQDESEWFVTKKEN